MYFSFMWEGGEWGRGPKPRSQSQTDHTSRGHLGAEPSHKNTPRNPRLTQIPPRETPASEHPQPHKTQVWKTNRRTSKTDSRTNPPQTKPASNKTPPNNNPAFERDLPRKTPAGAFVRPQMLLFGRRSFCFTAGAFDRPQVLLFGRRCFRLAAGCFCSAAGAFVRPPARPPAQASAY